MATQPDREYRHLSYPLPSLQLILLFFLAEIARNSMLPQDVVPSRAVQEYTRVIQLIPPGSGPWQRRSMVHG